MTSRTLPSIAIAVCLVLAGCGAGTTGDANTVDPSLEGTPSVSPTATETAAPTPPGVGEETVLGDLQTAHAEAFRAANRSFTYRSVSRAANGTAMRTTTLRVAVEGTEWLGESTVGGAVPLRPPVVDRHRRYANESVVVSTTRTAGGEYDGRVQRRRGTATGVPDGAAYVYRLLSGVDLRVTDRTETDHGTILTVRGSAETAPGVAGATRRNVSVVAEIRADGLVVSADATFDDRVAGVPVETTQSFRLTERTGTTVERPVWVPAVIRRNGTQTTPA